MYRRRIGLVFGISVFILLTGTFGTVLNVPLVKGDSGTIYIRANGSIDPSDAPISTFDNVTYTLTGNITSDSHGIVVLRSNIVIDGAGYTLQCTGALSTGIDVESGSNVTIKNARIKGFDSGISFFGDTSALKFSKVWGNHIINCSNGITGGGFSYNIAGNNITNSTWGVKLFASSNNTIVGNNIIANDKGIALWDGSSNNSISGNNLESNFYGIMLVYGSSDNKILHNNFLNNKIQVDSSGLANVWDDGYPSGGNYWSNYTGVDVKSGSYQNETGSDGIGDIPFIFDSSNQDNYPLMHSWSSLPVHNMNTGLGYVTIQGAIDSNETLNGHTIFVEEGIYYEHPVVNKEVSLIGEETATTVIDGTGTGTVITVTASNVMIANFTIQNSGSWAPFPKTGIYLNGGNTTKIQNNKIANNDDGIYADASHHNDISRNNITNNLDSGIRLIVSNNDTICENNLTENRVGIYLDGSHNNTVYRNDILNSRDDGIFTNVAHNNNVHGNTLTNNGYGCEFHASSDNILWENNVTNNKYKGISLDESSGNKIYHNNFDNDANNVFDYSWLYQGYAPSVNVWSNGYPSGGNCWSDYNGVDANHDGIGDTPYIIDANNVDHYPLMTQYIIPEFPSFLVLPLFMLLTMVAVMLIQTKILRKRKMAGDVT